METDVQYYTRRASEERLAAMRSAHVTVRQAHLDMAQRYDERVTALSSAEPRRLDVTTAA
jgi:hypothetical protein